MTLHHSRITPRQPAYAVSVGKDWRKVEGPICRGNPGGPEWRVRIISTGRLYSVGDFAYQRMARFSAEPTPEGWLEISEDGEPVEYEAEDRACSTADRLHQSKCEEL